MTTEYPAPEQRVRDYLELKVQHVADDIDVDLIDWVGYPHRQLTVSDLRDVLNELEEHRQILIQIDEMLDREHDTPQIKLAWLRNIMGNHTQKRATE